MWRIRHVNWRACASSGAVQSPLIDMRTITSSSTWTFSLPGLGGLLQGLTSCFKVLIFFSDRRTWTNKNEPSLNPLTMLRRESHSRRSPKSRLTLQCCGRAVAAADSISRHAGRTCFSSRHVRSWRWRQKQSAENFNKFRRAPLRLLRHFRWPITPSFGGPFFSFF